MILLTARPGDITLAEILAKRPELATPLAVVLADVGRSE